MPPSPPPAATWGDEPPSPTVSVIIPALNEENNLPLVLEGLPPVDEVIVVDGGSSDDTVAIAREVRPDALVIRQTRTGKGNALVCGFAASTGDIVITLNADGSTDPGEIPRYVDALLAGAEVAHGSRYREGGGDLDEGRWDRIGNRAFSWIVNLLFGTRFTDLGFGYNAFWRGLVPVLDLPSAAVPGLRRATRLWGDGPEIEPLINIRMAVQGLRVVEVASVGYPRIYGIRERRPMREGTQAVRTALAEYVRRRRIGRQSSRPASSHAARHGSGPGSTGTRTARHPIALPAAPFFPDEDLFPDNDLESTGRHSIERLVPDRIPQPRNPGWSDLTHDVDEQRTWRASYTDPDAGGPAVPDGQTWGIGGRRGRPDLTVISGEGISGEDWRSARSERRSHLRAVSGDQYGDV